MNNRKNFMSMAIMQLVTLLHGLIVPRMIIGTFGSEVNGLVSSITQFLSFISLLEGGLGAVVLAELYGPIENKDTQRIRSILSSSQKFFTKLAGVFLVYSVVLAIAYPLCIVRQKQNTFGFMATLVMILSFSTLTQYLFSITNKLYLQAEQKIYIVNYVTMVTLLLNIAVTIVIIKVFPQIHILKLASAIVNCIQPFVYRYYVNRKLKPMAKESLPAPYALSNRWSGFFQNLAHFINMNTDVALITIFATLTDVSIYSVYMIAINALRSIITNLDNSYQSALGKYIAQNDGSSRLKKKFNNFDKLNWIMTLTLYLTCLLLINPFVKIYTKGVEDANYYNPTFALVMVLANMIYCMREPYRLVILAAGKFKQTNWGSALEAGINFCVSLFLIRRYGIVGAAIGTFIAISYRMIYFTYYLRKDILFKEYTEYLKQLLITAIVSAVNVFLYVKWNISISNYGEFAVLGIIVVAAELVLVLGVFWLVDRKSFNGTIIESIKRRRG